MRAKKMALVLFIENVRLIRMFYNNPSVFVKFAHVSFVAAACTHTIPVCNILCTDIVQHDKILVFHLYVH